MIPRPRPPGEQISVPSISATTLGLLKSSAIAMLDFFLRQLRQAGAQPPLVVTQLSERRACTAQNVGKKAAQRSLVFFINGGTWKSTVDIFAKRHLGGGREGGLEELEARNSIIFTGVSRRCCRGWGKFFRLTRTNRGGHPVDRGIKQDFRQAAVTEYTPILFDAPRYFDRGKYPFPIHLMS